MTKSEFIKQLCNWSIEKVGDLSESGMKQGDFDLVDDAHAIYAEFMEWIDEEYAGDVDVIFLDRLKPMRQFKNEN